MKMNLSRYLIPGFVFQSVMIGGGYGTGAEIAQFFGVSGLRGGLMGMGVTFLVWTVICAVTFEFVRLYKTYDYGSMMRELLGPLGFLYDICYYLMMFIVLGVMNATAGSLVNSMTGLSPWVGIIILSMGTVWLVMGGTAMIEKALSFWSYVLYAVYILFMIIVFNRFGGTIAAEWAKAEVAPGWLASGLRYSFYNLVVVPLVLYTVRDASSRKEALLCGLSAGLLGIIPAVLLLFVMGANLPEVVKASVPVSVVFNMIDMKWFSVLFQVVLFGTLIETDTGFIKAVLDRLNVLMERHNRPLSTRLNATIVMGVVMMGVAISTFGLLGLIVKGYGSACWGFLFLFALPMMTVGVYKIAKASR